MQCIIERVLTFLALIIVVPDILVYTAKICTTAHISNIHSTPVQSTLEYV